MRRLPLALLALLLIAAAPAPPSPALARPADVAAQPDFEAYAQALRLSPPAILAGATRKAWISGPSPELLDQVQEEFGQQEPARVAAWLEGHRRLGAGDPSGEGQVLLGWVAERSDPLGAAARLRLAWFLARGEQYPALYANDFLVASWPAAADTPKAQLIIAQLYADAGRKEEAHTIVERLASTFGPGSAWWMRWHKGGAEAAEAREVVAQALAMVAVERQVAAEGGEAADWQEAARAHAAAAEIVAVGPARVQHQLAEAECTREAGEAGAALALFHRLVEAIPLGGPGEGFAVAAMWRRLTIRMEEVQAVGGAEARSVGALPVDGGGFALDTVHQGFVDAAVALLEADLLAVVVRARGRLASAGPGETAVLRDELEHAGTFAQALVDQRSEIELTLAQVLLAHGRVAEARPWLERIVEEEGETAAEAARLLGEG